MTKADNLVGLLIYRFIRLAFRGYKMLAKIAAIIATLEETNGSPESMLYIFFDMDTNMYNKVRDILVESGMVQIKGNFVTLTPKGSETAKKLNAAIQKH